MFIGINSSAKQVKPFACSNHKEVLFPFPESSKSKIDFSPFETADAWKKHPSISFLLFSVFFELIP
jgi:hypothetical protein